MTQIINPQGYIEDEHNGGRMNVVSSDMTDAKIDPQGYFYKEETINGITGRMPVVSVEGIEGGEEILQTIPTLQQVTDVGGVTTNPIAAGLAVTDAQLPTLGQAKSLLLPRSDKNADGSVYVHQNVLLWENRQYSFTGIIKILLPNGFSDNFVHTEIDIYNYSQVGASKLIVAGYNSAGGSWINYTAAVLGNFSYSIRLGYDSVAGKCCILLGNTTTVWSNTSLVLSKVKISFSNTTYWASGYSASVITTETGLTSIVTPNKLSYEEGSWTPSIQGSATAGVANYTERSGSYTKNGRIVNIMCRLIGTFTTPPTGIPIISGLPFACSALHAVPVSNYIGYANADIKTIINPYSTTIEFRIMGGLSTTASAAQFGTDLGITNIQINMQATYFI